MYLGCFSLHYSYHFEPHV